MIVLEIIPCLSGCCGFAFQMWQRKCDVNVSRLNSTPLAGSRQTKWEKVDKLGLTFNSNLLRVSPTALQEHRQVVRLVLEYRVVPLLKLGLYLSTLGFPLNQSVGSI